MMILTFWEDPLTGKHDPDDYDELFHVRPKSVRDVKHWIAARPPQCSMISLERSGPATKNGKVCNPENPRYFREVWKRGQPTPDQKPPRCPMCGRPYGY